MGFDSIIALDLGKFKSVAAMMNVGTRRHAFATLDTTPAALHELLATHAAEEPLRTLVVVECCDAAGWVADLATLLGMAVNTRKHLTVDEDGAVPADQAVKAATAARQTQIATVMMPIGAAVGVIGGVLALWPDRSSTRVSAVATPQGASVSVTGNLP